MAIMTCDLGEIQEDLMYITQTKVLTIVKEEKGKTLPLMLFGLWIISL
jgi:hypothetical protein